MIGGVQQIGVGVDDAEKTFRWFATNFGFDVPIFDDDNTAVHMKNYMGGKPHEKRAIMIMNMGGGGGMEVWQYLNRKPQKADSEIKIGDFGINLIKIKSNDIKKSYDRLRLQKVELISEIVSLPDKRNCFYVKDPFGNIIQIAEYSSWLNKKRSDTGGVFGCMIGVSSIEKSMKLYRDVLEYDIILDDQTGKFEDLSSLPNGDKKFRRVLLGHKNNKSGPFQHLLGESQIELIEGFGPDRKGIFTDRYWGDLGYIHVCFDAVDLNSLLSRCENNGFPCRVRSNDSFEMGNTNGNWAYIEDPDGTLIEFVEPLKVPLIKALKWDLNLRKRNQTKPLPKWIINCLAFKRVKFNGQGD